MSVTLLWKQWQTAEHTVAQKSQTVSKSWNWKQFLIKGIQLVLTCWSKQVYCDNTGNTFVSLNFQHGFVFLLFTKTLWLLHFKYEGIIPVFDFTMKKSWNDCASAVFLLLSCYHKESWNDCASAVFLLPSCYHKESWNDCASAVFLLSSCYPKESWNDRISAVFLLPWRNQEMTVLSSFPTPFLLLWRNHEMTSLQRLSYNLLRVSDYKNTQYKVSLSLHVHFVSAILCWIGSTSYVICILSSEKFIHNTQQ